MQRFIDVSLPLGAGVPGFPGDPPFLLEPVRRLSAGDPCNLSRLTMGTHAGTHVDAPAHFLEGGAGVDALPLEILVGKARVLDLPGLERIERRHLESADLRDDIRVLIKTRTGGRPGDGGSCLSADAATYLVQAGLKLVGFDELSIDGRATDRFPAHRILLGAGVIVVEGLELAAVEPGDYDMTCLPLRLVGGDGSPARVVLRARG